MTRISFGIAIAETPAATSSSGSGSGSAHLPEPALYRDLTVAGQSMDIDVFVFAAIDYDPRTGGLQGWRYRSGNWARETVPLPDVVYDRCFFASVDSREKHLQSMAFIAARKPHRRLNGKLPSKLAVYGHLSKSPSLRPYLPPTEAYAGSIAQLIRGMERHRGGIVLKPAAGMQGRGAIHLKRCPSTGHWLASGRTAANRPLSRSMPDETALAEWLGRFMKRSAFLVQPYLPLQDSLDRPFDIRVLLQKNGQGRWKVSGSAARIGKAGTLTSNLHGGGTAVPAASALWAGFGQSEGERLLDSLHTISRHAAARLESGFGRFGELAFDFGVDPAGKPWLLEANSKPGRSSFRLAGDAKAQQLSIRRPLSYAKYLLERSAVSAEAHSFAYSRFSCGCIRR